MLDVCWKCLLLSKHIKWNGCGSLTAIIAFEKICKIILITCRKNNQTENVKLIWENQQRKNISKKKETEERVREKKTPHKSNENECSEAFKIATKIKITDNTGYLSGLVSLSLDYEKKTQERKKM